MEEIYLQILNLKHREDRRAECLAVLESAGVFVSYDPFFEAKYTPEDGAVGCALSHAHLISNFLFSCSQEYLLVLEDDVSLSDPVRFRGDLGVAISSHNDWNVYLLSHNKAIPIAVTSINNCFRVVNSQTASGYIVGRSYAPTLVFSFYRSAELLRKNQGLPSVNRALLRDLTALDMLWKELQIRDRFVAPFPSLVRQRPSYSDIEKKFVNYGV